MRAVVFDDLLYTRKADFDVPGIDLHFFEHADACVAVVEALRPDLVLMDYSMDDHLTGEEAVTVLRARWPRGQLEITGISSDNHSNERLVAAGADDAVPKSHLRGYLRLRLRRLEAEGAGLARRARGG